MRRLVVGVLALLALAGCTATGEPDPSLPHAARTVPSVAPSGPGPAALSGGACLLVDFAVINKALGTTFDAAAAAQSGDTYTCQVLESATKSSLPGLSLSVTATTIDPLTFTALVDPGGAKPVPKLGKIAYVLVSGTTKTEIGWLSGNDRVMILVYTYPKSASTSDVTAMTKKLESLARTIDGTAV